MALRRSIESSLRTSVGGDDRIVEMSALGRSAHLGDLYDIRRERFCISPVGRNRVTLATCPNALPRDLSRSRPSMHVSHTWLDDDGSNALENRFGLLGVSPPQLRLSVISGLVEPEVFGAYLLERGDRDGGGMSTVGSASEQAVPKAALFCQVSSCERVLDFSSFPGDLDDHACRQLQAMETEMEGATHLVSGVVLGATVLASIACRPLALSHPQPGRQQQADGGSSPGRGAAAIRQQAKARLDGRLMALEAALQAQSPSDGCLTAESRWRQTVGDRDLEAQQRMSLQTSLPLISSDLDLLSSSGGGGGGASGTWVLPRDGNPAISGGGDGGAALGEKADDVTVRIFTDLVWETGSGPSSRSLPELKALLERVSRIRGYNRRLAVPIAIRLTPLADFIRWHQQRLSAPPLDEAMRVLRHLPLAPPHPDDKSISDTMLLFQEMDDLEKDVEGVLHQLAIAVRAHGDSIIVQQETDVIAGERRALRAARQQLRRLVAEVAVQIRSSPMPSSIPLTEVLHTLGQRFRLQQRRRHLAGVLSGIKEASEEMALLKRKGVRFYNASNEGEAIGTILAEHPGQSVYVLVHRGGFERDQSWERNLGVLKQLVSVECQRLGLRRRRMEEDTAGEGGEVDPANVGNGVGGGGLKASAGPADAAGGAEESRCFFYFLEVWDSAHDGLSVVSSRSSSSSSMEQGPGGPTTTIKLFCKGSLLVDDVADRIDHVARLCIVRSSEMALDSRVSFTSSVSGPQTSAPLRALCPGSTSGQCRPIQRDWFCERCAVQVDHCSDGYVYCDCGRAPVKSLSFLCRDPGHMSSWYMSYDRPVEDVADQVNAVSPADRKEVNILLLGESGVGKSTFINAFANYLRHQAMDAAMEDLVALIPSSFTVCQSSEDFSSLRVTVGEQQDANEQAGAGKSATQSCKAYVFGYGGYKVRLIDTPGIGDTRGIEQDRANFGNILRFLGYHQNLHGICVLLKPNCPRLNVMFRFCAMELLSHLHSSAKDNLAFVFTNARSTFYRPGDTLTVLTEMVNSIRQSPPHVNVDVNSQSVYCLDSESFRFLAALKHGVRFTEKEEEDFRHSWEVSSTECRRLMDFILKRRPHKVQDTMRLNQARRRVLQLAGPLAEINRLVQFNQKRIEEKTLEINSATTKIAELKERPKQEVTDVEVKYAPEPLIVCNGSGCRDFVMLDGEAKYHYRTVCHVPCRESTGSFDVVSERGIRSCSVMRSDGKCGRCGCDWAAHKRTMKTTSLINYTRVDPAVQASLTSSSQTLLSLTKELANLQQRSVQLGQEHRIVSSTSRRFALFLRHHAIKPYNDALLEYVSHLIEEAKTSDQADDGGEGEREGNKRKAAEELKRLEKLKESCENEAKIILDALTSTNQSDRMDEAMLSAEGSRRCMGELYALAINGQMIKGAVEESERRAVDPQFRYCEALVRTSKARGWADVKRAPHFPNPLSKSRKPPVHQQLFLEWNKGSAVTATVLLPRGPLEDWHSDQSQGEGQSGDVYDVRPPTRPTDRRGTRPRAFSQLKSFAQCFGSSPTHD